MPFVERKESEKITWIIYFIICWQLMHQTLLHDQIMPF